MAAVLAQQESLRAEDKPSGLLPVTLRRNKHLDDLSKYVSASLHVETLHVVLVSHDGYLSVRCLDGKSEGVSCLGRVQRCLWTNSQSPPVFVAMTADLRLVWVIVSPSNQERVDPVCTRACYVTPATIRRKLGDSAKNLTYKSITLVGLQSNNDVVLLIDNLALLVLSVSLPDDVTSEIEAHVDIVSSCFLRLPSVHEFAEPLVIIPAECQPVSVKLAGHVAVVAWSNGDYFTFCNLETGEVLMVVNARLTFTTSSAPSLLTANGAVEFSVSPDLSHLAVSCVFSTPPVARRGHLRQGSSASRTSGDDRHASGMSPFLFDSDIAGSRGVSDGNGLHFINILKYVYQHPGHVNPKVVTKALHSQGSDKETSFPYVSDNVSNWNEEADDMAFVSPATRGVTVGDALWHRELGSLRRGVSTIDAVRLGMPVSAGTVPRCYRDDSTAQSVMVFIRCLASAHSASNDNIVQKAPTPVGKDGLEVVLPPTSTLDHRKDCSGLVAAAVDAIESLVDQARLNATSSSNFQMWQPAKKCNWRDGFLPLSASSQSLDVADVILGATTVAVLLLPRRQQMFPASASAAPPSDTSSGAVVVYSSFDNSSVVYPLPQYCLPVSIGAGHLPHCLLLSQQLFTVVYGIQQEDIVNRLILYENAVLAEMMCRLNHWERCSLPLTALDSALTHKQLDSVAFFLNSQQGGSLGEDEAEDGTANKKRGAPKLAPAQVEIAIDLLTQAVERSASKANFQYCQQLLHLALSFLHRLTEATVTRLAEAEEDEEEDDEFFVIQDESEESLSTPVQSLSYHSYLSNDSRSSRLRMFSEASTVASAQVDITQNLSVEKLSKAVARLRTFVKPAPSENDSGTSSGRSNYASPVTPRASTTPRASATPSEMKSHSASQSWPERWKELEEEEVIRDSILTSRVASAQAYLVCTSRQWHISALEVASSTAVRQSCSESTSMTGLSGDIVTASSSGRQSVQSAVSRSSSVVPFSSSRRASPQVPRHAASVDKLGDAVETDIKEALQDAMRDDSPLVARRASFNGNASRKTSAEDSGTTHSALTRVLSQEYCTPAVDTEPWRGVGSFERILAVGTEMVLHSLMDRNFVLAVKLLENLGCDVREHVRRICLHTVSRPLRDYLVEELTRRQWLSEDELHVVRYVHLLERLYPSESYSNVQNELLSAVDANVVPGKKRLPLNLNNLGLPSRADVLAELHSPGELDSKANGAALEMASFPTIGALGGQSSITVPGLNAPGSGGGYAQVSLDSVSSWSKDSRERVLLEQLVSGWNSTSRTSVDWSKLVSANSEWRYHLDHLNQGSITQCIQQWIPALQEAVNVTTERRTSTASAVTPTAGPVTVLSDANLWEGLSHCPAHIRELVDDELATRGVFSEDELGNFTRLMRRLGRNQILFNRPNALGAVKTLGESSSPASAVSSSESANGAQRHAVAVPEPTTDVPASLAFHRSFIDYCVKNRLPNVLYRYLDYHDLGRSETSIEKLGLTAATSNLWLSCLSRFRLAASDPTNSHALFKASIANAHLCLANMLSGAEEKIPISLMISTKHRLMALATLMYIPGGLDELLDSFIPSDPKSPTSPSNMRTIRDSDSPNGGDAFEIPMGSSSEWPVAAEVLREAVHAYPQLRAAMFPVSNANKSPAELQDITLYQLLQGNSPFNADRLFRWQDTNRVPLPEEEDYLRDFPHFAQTGLVSKYGHVERLSFVYYLRQGQPSVAMATFVAQHHFEGPAGKASMERATARAMRLALRHFTDSKIVGACTVFCELLGCDSLRLRVSLESANRVLAYTGRGVTAEVASSQFSRASPGLSEHRRTGSDVTAALSIASNSEKAQPSQPSPQLVALLGADALCKDQTAIAKDFLSLESGSPAPSHAKDVLRYLEAATHLLISQHGYGKVSVEAAYSWHLVLSFCRLHNLPLSTEFLKQCALESQWLPFICHAQQHQFEPSQALDVIDCNFVDPDLREHLRLAFSNMEATPELGKRPRPLPPPVPQPKPKTLFKDVEEGNSPQLGQQKDIRAHFYSYVGVQGQTASLEAASEDSTTSTSATMTTPRMLPYQVSLTESIEGEESRTPIASIATGHLSPRTLTEVIASSPRHFSASTLSGSSPPPPLVAQHATNIFEVLLACNATDNPSQSLLAHCIALENPVLAVLAACYPNHDILSCFCAWLCATCGSDLLADALPSLSDGSIVWRSWAWDDLLLLILSAVDSRPARTRALVAACSIFDKDNLLFQLLSFHESFVILNDPLAADKHLKAFVEKLALLSGKNQASGRLLIPTSSLQDLSVRLVRSTLCQCTRTFQRSELVAMLAKCGFGRSFLCRVPDFTRLYQLRTLLEEGGVNPDLVFAGTTLIDTSPPVPTPAIHPGPRRAAPYLNSDVTFVGNAAQVAAVEALLENERFDAARSYALLVGVGADMVTKKEVAVFYKDMRRSSLWNSEERRISFWHDCSQIFVKHSCSPDVPAEFFKEEVAGPEGLYSPDASIGSQSPTSSGDAVASEQAGDGESDDGCPFLISTVTDVQMTLKEKAHVLCLQLYWQRQFVAGDGEFAPGHGEKLADLRALEQEVWMCRLRAEVKIQASHRRLSVSNSLLPSTQTQYSNPALAPSHSLSTDWSLDPASLTRLLDDLLEDKSLELRRGIPSLVDKGHQQGGQLFEGRGWAENLHTDLTYTGWKNKLAERAAVKATLDAKELSCLELLEDRLLAAKRFSQAYDVAVMFGHASRDLEILMTSLRLVHQLTTAAQLTDTDSAEGDILKKVTKKAAAPGLAVWRPPIARTGSQSAVSDWLRSCGLAALEVTRLLQDLAERSTLSKACCAQVTVAYQIATFLNASYEVVIGGSALLILSKLLASTEPCAFPLAQQFVAVSGLSDEEVIGFLGDSVVNAIRNAYGLPLSHATAPALSQRPSLQQFTQLSSLCQNQVLLASHLMSACTAAASSTDVSQATLALEVDLLINAHSCYTSACDMEGIGTIVRTCRQRVPVLAAAGQFQQMIHLVTGVGRYREMLFVFESLVEHEKLDLLLRRDTNKEDELKVVLLDYLRKNRPDDTDIFSKVATHYNMWRELASVLEKQADKELKVLKTHAVDSSMAAPLEGVVRRYVAAAENFMKKNCLRHAQRCMHRARLAALQRRFLPSGTRITNLQPKELRGFMEEHPNFNESLLVAEAYRSRGLLEWVKPVYVNVIQRGLFRYMHDLTNSLPMANALVKEVAARYRRDSQLTSLNWSSGQRQQYAANMRELLEHVSDPRVTYQLAKDLGFSDMVTSLLDSQEGQFLQDAAPSL